MCLPWQELYTEKENQLRKQVSDLECQLGDFKQELESTRKLLNEAQVTDLKQALESTLILLPPAVGRGFSSSILFILCLSEFKLYVSQHSFHPLS